MLIHEIFSKPAINEDFPVKGMRPLQRDPRGRFVGRGAAAFAGMAQQLGAPGAAPAGAGAFSSMAQQLAPTPPTPPTPTTAPRPAPAPIPPTAPSPAASPNASVAPAAQAPKASGFRNAAEYLAQRAMTAAGVPGDQQRDMAWHPGGHVAASMGIGSSSIVAAQNQMAERLGREWLRTQTLNGDKTAQSYTPQSIPNLNDVKDAIELANNAGQRLPINSGAAAQRAVDYIKKAHQQAQQTMGQSQP